MLFLHDFCVHDSLQRGQCQLEPLGMRPLGAAWILQVVGGVLLKLWRAGAADHTSGLPNMPCASSHLKTPC